MLSHQSQDGSNSYLLPARCCPGPHLVYRSEQSTPELEG